MYACEYFSKKIFAAIGLVLSRLQWPDSLLDGTEMGPCIHRFDWSNTSLGAIESWPASLRHHVNMIVSHSMPMYLFCGPEHLGIYNDAYARIAGDKHPKILGIPNRDAWGDEVWMILAPILADVATTGKPVMTADQLFPIERFGFTEEVYCDIAYSALRDEAGEVSSILVTLAETTEKVLSRRRLETLRALAGYQANVRTESEAYERIGATLNANADVAFALLYIAAPHESALSLVVGVDVDGNDDLAVPRIEIDGSSDDDLWQLTDVLGATGTVVVHDLETRFGRLPGGRWPEYADAAIVAPVRLPHQDQAIGAMIIGVSPRLSPNDDYREFVTMAASQIANVILGARAFEAERERAKTLVEIDRAKTEFFHNVSHEFRTPLTLMLGPLEGLIAVTQTAHPDLHTDLVLVHRNASRLQRLVNALLDFSRVESGIARTSLLPTDVTRLTERLVSQFRPVIETVRLRFVVDIADCGIVALDHEIWETILFNLLSNAYKFTFLGEIRISLKREEAQIVLAVSDTGEGIDEADISKLFKRFHRVESTRSRTHEGSGIGLALVSELAALHEGEIRVESQLGFGSTFTVTLPAHEIPAMEVSSRDLPVSSAPSMRGNAFVSEMMLWNANPADLAVRSASRIARSSCALPDSSAPCILLADDNADMREYIERLLRPHYRVISVTDGESALAAAKASSPDLILTDVMMPILDGFALLAEIRADARLRTVPVVMLSARAGEEAAVAGLRLGADDYIVKPFSANELLARVQTNISLSRLRREYEREHLVAESYQRASLPQMLPNVHGVSFDALYSAGSDDATVGGDWYDAVRLIDGRVVVSIGDVAGSGIAAAVTMGNMRQIIRGIAQVYADPVLMLDAADRALKLEYSDLYVTAFVGILDPVMRTLTYASAGHPPPIMRHAAHHLELLTETGLPLGLRNARTPSAARTVEIPEGAILVLYTDGLTEATRDPIEGQQRIEAALLRDEIAFAPHPAQAIKAAVLDAKATGDDVAILTVSMTGARIATDQRPRPVMQRWVFEVSDGEAAQNARHEFVAMLRGSGASLDDVAGAELIFGELIGNVVRYAPGSIEITVDWSGPLPVLHVLDQGPGFRHVALLPTDVYSESGRGLFLVSALTEDFHVSKRPERGSHARAVLSLDRSRFALVPLAI